MPRVNSLQNYEYYMTLYNRVKSMEQNPSLIRERYGSIGVDIFEGRTPTILTKEEMSDSKKLINRIKSWWNGTGKLDYEKKDRLSDTIMKYAYNKQKGTIKEVERLFGKEGAAELKRLSDIGMIII